MPKSSAKESACSRNNYRQAADYQQAAWGEVLGPIWQRAVLWREAPYLMHTELHPTLLWERPSAPWLPSLREAQLCQREGNCPRCARLCPGSPRGKAGWLSLVWGVSGLSLLHQVGISAQISTGGRMHLLSIFLVESHSFSIISSMIDLFFFLFLTSPWLLFYCWLKLYCKTCSAKCRLTIKRQDVVGIIPNCYSLGGLSVRGTWTISLPWWMQLLVESAEKSTFWSLFCCW